MDGSDTMLIWLGKVVLHQKEKTSLTLEATDTLAEFIQSIREARGWGAVYGGVCGRQRGARLGSAVTGRGRARTCC